MAEKTPAAEPYVPQLLDPAALAEAMEQARARAEARVLAAHVGLLAAQVEYAQAVAAVDTLDAALEADADRVASAWLAARAAGAGTQPEPARRRGG